jgi:hypothetical protein
MVTVLVAVPTFPDASVAVYVTVYVPRVFVSTVPQQIRSTSIMQELM